MLQQSWFDLLLVFFICVCPILQFYAASCDFLCCQLMPILTDTDWGRIDPLQISIICLWIFIVRKSGLVKLPTSYHWSHCFQQLCCSATELLVRGWTWSGSAPSAPLPLMSA